MNVYHWSGKGKVNGKGKCIIDLEKGKEKKENVSLILKRKSKRKREKKESVSLICALVWKTEGCPTVLHQWRTMLRLCISIYSITLHTEGFIHSFMMWKISMFSKVIAIKWNTFQKARFIKKGLWHANFMMLWEPTAYNFPWGQKLRDFFLMTKQNAQNCKITFNWWFSC